MKTFLFTVWFISPVVVIIFPCNQSTKRWKLITLDNCLCAFFVIVAILFFLLSMKVQSVYQYCSDNSDNKTFWCNLIRITGLPVSFHKISISFHYFQIDDSNKAGSVAVGNLLYLFCHFYCSVLTLTDCLFQYSSMIMRIEKHYCFLFEYYKYVLIKKYSLEGMKLTNFSLTLKYIKLRYLFSNTQASCRTVPIVQ